MHTTVAAERTVALPPQELFALFGNSRAGGWLFEARCEVVRAGATVSMRLPLDGHRDGQGVDVVGRLARVVSRRGPRRRAHAAVAR